MHKDGNSNQTPQSQASYNKEKKFDPYSGGRSLNAIWASCLNGTEKLILQFLGSQLDFRSDFLQTKKLTQKFIAKKCTKTSRTVMKTFLALEEKGYVKINPSDDSTGNFYSLTTKIFDEYTELACEETSHANQPCEEKGRGGVKKLHRGCEKTSYQYSLLTPFLIPFNLSAPLKHILTHVNTEEVKFTMPINGHPLTEILMKSKKHRDENRKTQNKDVEALGKKIGTDISPDRKTNHTRLFNAYQSHFRGGSGRFCYKAQRSFWDRIIDERLESEAEETLNFYHGVDKPTAQKSAGQKRMTDDQYVEFLFSESKGIRERILQDKKDHEETKRQIAEREAMLANRTPEEIQARKEKLKKLAEKFKKPSRRNGVFSY